MTKERLEALLYNAIILLEDECEYDNKQLQDELGITENEYNKIMGNVLLGFYQSHVGNYIIPIDEFENIQEEITEFLKSNKNYFLMYLNKDNGYEEEYWCITNYLE